MALSRSSGARGERRKPASAAAFDLRSAGQDWLSRQLHDDLGPSLCAAGLQLSLMRTGLRDIPADSAEAFDNVQAILERAVETVRLLSYAVSPANAAKCGIRDMTRMLARAFQAEVPEFDSVPPATPPAAVEFAGQLLDCLLLLPAPQGQPPPRVFLFEDSVAVDAPGRIRRVLLPLSQRRLRFWSCTVRERTRLGRTTIEWNLSPRKVLT